MSLQSQMGATRQSLTTATETLRLTRERKQLGVGAVLEDIQAQQELARSRARLLKPPLSNSTRRNTTQQGVGRCALVVLTRKKPISLRFVGAVREPPCWVHTKRRFINRPYINLKSCHSKRSEKSFLVGIRTFIESRKISPSGRNDKNANCEYRNQL